MKRLRVFANVPINIGVGSRSELILLEGKKVVKAWDGDSFTILVLEDHTALILCEYDNDGDRGRAYILGFTPHFDDYDLRQLELAGVPQTEIAALREATAKHEQQRAETRHKFERAEYDRLKKKFEGQ